MRDAKRNSNDGPLHGLLQEWQSQASLPPGFQDQVWRRIDHSAAAPVPTATLAQLFAAWLSSKLPQPALAMAYVALLLLVGVGVGWSQARQETARVTTELSSRYVHAVDPYRSIP